MKKILVVHSSGANSGAEKISSIIHDHLSDSFSFSFFVPEMERKAKFGRKTETFYSTRRTIIGKAWELRKHLRRGKPEIIHAHGTRAALLIKIALLTAKKKFKFIYTIHGFHLAHRPGILFKLAMFMENLSNFIFVDAIVCVGSEDYCLVKKYSWSKKKVILIKNALGPSEPKEDAEIEKLRGRNNFLILTICRLHYQKDVMTLMDSLAYLPPGIKVVIIGDGPQRRMLENSAKSNIDKVLFLGDRDNAASLIHYFDCFVLSSHWEGRPLVILEAMLAKVLVIGSDVHGIRELIKDGETGFLFKEGDARGLSKKIIAAARDSGERGRIAEKAREMVVKEYPVDEMIRKYQKIYSE